MKVKRITGSVEILIPLIESWQKEYALNDFGIVFDLATALGDLQNLVEGGQSALLVLMDRGDIVGFMGLQSFDSPLGNQEIGEEHYWYVRPENRGIGSMRLFHAAKEWATERGCSHLIMNASMMAGPLHDKVCEFYEKTGMKKFETSYICEV